MNVSELRALADWYNSQYQDLSNLYNELLQPISHNSSQPNKIALVDQLERLTTYLRDMKFSELSLQQIKALDDIGLIKYLGNTGADYVESAIKTGDYDAATAAQRLTTAISKLSESNSAFVAFENSLRTLGLFEKDTEVESDHITIRVGFQNEAAIKDIVDWKDSAKDWYEIVRGLAIATNESPEDTKVIGASTGSIILILSGTLAFTTLLALISKQVSSMAKDVIGIGDQIEELRRKKLLNKVIENELKKQESQLTTKALADTMKMISDKLVEEKAPPLDGEKMNALESSIKKLLMFNEKGGNVDFVSPDEDGDQDEGDGADANLEPMTALGEARNAIREYQTVREQIKQLEDRRGNPQ